MAPGARSKFGVPMFKLELFQEQIYCIKKSTCDIVEIFQRSHSAPGEWCPSFQSVVLYCGKISRGESVAMLPLPQV